MAEPNVSKDDLITYLSQAVRLETAIYEMEKAYEAAKAKLEMGQVTVIEPVEPRDTSGRIPRPVKPEYENEGAAKMWAAFCILGFIDLIFAITIGFDDFTGMAIVVSLFVMIFFGGLALSVKSNNDDKRTTYEKAMEEYRTEVETSKTRYAEAMAKYEEDLADYETEFRSQTYCLKANYETAEAVVEQMREPIADLQDTLDELYAIGWIYPKYRNMVAVCNFYDYFASGRVNTLTGPDGAYNLYEEELRGNMIISRLDQIITSLDEIRKNQYTLYQELKDIDRKLGRVSADITRIACDTGELVLGNDLIQRSLNVTECMAKAIERNTAAQNYLMTLHMLQG